MNNGPSSQNTSSQMSRARVVTNHSGSDLPHGTPDKMKVLRLSNRMLCVSNCKLVQNVS
jgi:hypothetical protein